MELKGKTENDKESQLKLNARIHTRYGITRKINIKDSIRQGGVLPVIEYTTPIDEIVKEQNKAA